MAELVDLLRERTDEMLGALQALVDSESPSEDPGALAATAEVVAALGAALLGAPPERLDAAGGTPVLRWRRAAVGCPGGEPVLLLCHLDTVWPLGTTARWPFAVADGRATGPGAFDMKAGIVQGLHALAALAMSGRPSPEVVVLVTSDEEIGSPAGRGVLEAEAADARAVLVLEASADGRLKTARKGVGTYQLLVTGRAAHAGLEPERGVNALTEAARLVLALEGLPAPERGTTVTPTLSRAGSAQNTVPAQASVTIDVRAATIAEQERVDAALRALPVGPGAQLQVLGGINRPPLEEAASDALFALAQQVAPRCGVPALERAAVGGGSDGNFTAAMGVPTLDGLGAVGAGAHAEGEHVVVAAMPERAALVAEVIAALADAELPRQRIGGTA